LASGKKAFEEGTDRANELDPANLPLTGSLYVIIRFIA
jgi:hypothetical protein